MVGRIDKRKRKKKTIRKGRGLVRTFKSDGIE